MSHIFLFLPCFKISPILICLFTQCEKHYLSCIVSFRLATILQQISGCGKYFRNYLAQQCADIPVNSCRMIAFYKSSQAELGLN